jgi:hypothetical protein
LASFLNAQNGDAGPLATVGSDSYDVAHQRYPLPAWAQRFVARVDHAPAHWKRPATQGLTAAEALRLLEGLSEGRGDGSGRQEGQDGCKERLHPWQCAQAVRGEERRDDEGGQQPKQVNPAVG